MAARLIDRYRKVRKKWMSRIADSDGAADARCARCNERAPPVPITSRVSDAGLLVRTWRCAGCGNEWITSIEATP